MSACGMQICVVPMSRPVQHHGDVDDPRRPHAYGNENVDLRTFPAAETVHLSSGNRGEGYPWTAIDQRGATPLLPGEWAAVQDNSLSKHLPARGLELIAQLAPTDSQPNKRATRHHAAANGGESPRRAGCINQHASSLSDQHTRNRWVPQLVDATHSCGYRTVILSVRYGARSVSRSINRSGSQTTGTMSG